MPVDAPARIAVIGAGMMGLEAALYGRFLGYEVDVFELGEVGNGLRARPDDLLGEPFSRLASPLGVAALQAQDSQYRAPDPDAQLSCRQYFDGYLLPLSQSDLLVDRLKLHTRVTAVEDGGADWDLPSGPNADRAGRYRLTLSSGPSDDHAWADVVVDATGTNGLLASGLAYRRLTDRPLAEDDDVHLFVMADDAATPERGSSADGRFAPIQSLYSFLVGRSDLNVYTNMRKLLGSQ